MVTRLICDRMSGRGADIQNHDFDYMRDLIQEYHIPRSKLLEIEKIVDRHVDISPSDSPEEIKAKDIQSEIRAKIKEL